jgi:antitoxin PrlF
VDTRSTIISDGSVKLDKDLLDHLGVRPGDDVEIVRLPAGRVEIRSAKKTGSIDRFIGSLHRPGIRPLTIEEMNDVIARGWAGEL